LQVQLLHEKQYKTRSSTGSANKSSQYCLVPLFSVTVNFSNKLWRLHLFYLCYVYKNYIETCADLKNNWEKVVYRWQYDLLCVQLCKCKNKLVFDQRISSISKWIRRLRSLIEIDFLVVVRVHGLCKQFFYKDKGLQYNFRESFGCVIITADDNSKNSLDQWHWNGNRSNNRDF
jgi:hypothetical protein